jgi:hypothetical protein
VTVLLLLLLYCGCTLFAVWHQLLLLLLLAWDTCSITPSCTPAHFHQSHLPSAVLGPALAAGHLSAAAAEGHSSQRFQELPARCSQLHAGRPLVAAAAAGGGGGAASAAAGTALVQQQLH